MSWLYDVLFGWWLPKPKPQPKPKPVPKAATNLKAKVWRYTIMSQKADVKFMWVKSVSEGVVSQHFTVAVDGVLMHEQDLDPSVEMVKVDAFDANKTLDWAVKTVNKYGISATARSQFVIPDFSVAPATGLAAEVDKVYDDGVEPATDLNAEATDVQV